MGHDSRFENHKSKQNSRTKISLFKMFHRNMWVRGESVWKLKIIKYFCCVSSIWSSFFRSFIAKEASPVSSGLGAESAGLRSRYHRYICPGWGGLRPLSKGAAGFWASFPAGMPARRRLRHEGRMFCSQLTQEGELLQLCHLLQLWGVQPFFFVVIHVGCVWALGLSLGHSLVLLKLPPWVLRITLLSCHKFQMEPWDIWCSYGLEKTTHTGKR